MPGRGRQQTETRQSQATLSSRREGAASVEGRALWHRGDPTGAPHPSARVGPLSPPYPTLTGGLLRRLGTWLGGQPSFQPSLTARPQAVGPEAASGEGCMGQQRQHGGGRLAGEQGDGSMLGSHGLDPPGQDISVCHPSWGCF